MVAEMVAATLFQEADIQLFEKLIRKWPSILKITIVSIAWRDCHLNMNVT